MRNIAVRASGVAASVAALGLILAGCGDDESTPSVGDLTESAKSAVASATATPGSGSGGSGTATPGTGGAGSGTAAPGGATSTKIATPSGEIEISGEIYKKYAAVGGATSPLGEPTGKQEDAFAGPGGIYQPFKGGTIVYSPPTGAHVVWGQIRDKWNEVGGSKGELGYPLSDEEDYQGGKRSEFERGYITWKAGEPAQIVKK